MIKTSDWGRAALAAAMALCVAAPAFAQSTAPQTDPKNQGAGAHPATTGTTAAPSGGAPTDASKSVGGHPATSATTATGAASATAPTLDPWVTKYATEHQGRVSRQAYIDEMGRRFDTADKTKRGDTTRQAFLDDLARQWEAIDRGNQGLTPAEVSRINGKIKTF